MPDANIHAFPLNRHWGVTDERGLNLSQCDMYHPVFLKFIPGESELRKGPILPGMDQNHRNWILAYEHGSPDNETAKDYLKLGSSYQDHVLKLWISLEKGAFFDGETFTATNPFITPWMNFGTFEASDLDEGRKAFRNYLYDWQSETRSGRKPLIYYNTWGWQRDEENSYLNLSNIKDVRSGHKVYCDATVYDPLPYYHKDADGGPRKFFAPDEVLLDLPRLLQEIDAAYQLGADVFVIDDGWYDWMGDWQINPQWGAAGLAMIVKHLQDYGMRLGLWLAPTCIDPNSSFFKAHPENLARDQQGEVVPSRFGRKMACLVSQNYAEMFVAKCKRLIDLGCTYFKWDALDGWYCYSDQHEHGNSEHDPEARGHRYGYEFVRTVSAMAEQLIAYCPELVIVYDVTESGRNVGLDFLSQGRFFWMNNGASGSHDFSNYRAKSMRTIYQQYHSIIPLILQTSAQYPHLLTIQPKNRKAYGSQEYKIYSALVGGYGFWGNLKKMSIDERLLANEILLRYKQIAASVVAIRPKVTGSIGSSPEIWEFIDDHNAQGQVIAFSGAVMRYTYHTAPINRDRFLGIIGHAYQLLEDNRLEFNFEFTEPDSVRSAFILGNNTSGLWIKSATCWIKNLFFKSQTTLLVQNGAPGRIILCYPKLKKTPMVNFESRYLNYTIEDTANQRVLHFDIHKADCSIEIEIE